MIVEQVGLPTLGSYRLPWGAPSTTRSPVAGSGSGSAWGRARTELVNVRMAVRTVAVKRMLLVVAVTAVVFCSG